MRVFLYFSSGEVYGEIGIGQIPTKENDYGYLDPTNVRSCYAEGKRMGENMCASWFHQYKIPVKIVRPFHTYGPGIDLNDGRVFADFVADIANNRNIIMKSDGKAIRSFCYIADALSGFITVLLKGKNGEAYNVGNQKEAVSIKKLAEILVNLFPEKKLKIIRIKRSQNDKYMESKISINQPDITKISQLGWQPQFSIKEGFRRTIKSFINQY